MRQWTAQQVAAGGRRKPDRRTGGSRAVPSGSRSTRATPAPAPCSSGCPAQTHDGGRFRRAGAGGRGLGRADHARARRRGAPRTGRRRGAGRRRPAAALQRLATAWRRELGAEVIGVTGSTGKTSTKDLLSALLAGRSAGPSPRGRTSTPRSGCRSRSWPRPPDTEVLVLEMAMRGRRADRRAGRDRRARRRR